MYSVRDMKCINLHENMIDKVHILILLILYFIGNIKYIGCGVYILYILCVS